MQFLFRNGVVYLALLIILIFNGTVIAAESETSKEVIVKGTGETRDDAIRDALRSAVEQAVGVLIDSETVVTNAAVLKDEIYSKAHGFIQTFTVAAEEKHDKQVVVSIKALVSTAPNSALYSKLEALNLIQIGLQDPRIAVVLPEFHITRTRIPDPAGETAIIRKLLAGGFSRVVDAKQVEANYKKSLETTLNSGDYSAVLTASQSIYNSLTGLECGNVRTAFKRLSEAVAKNDIAMATVANKMLLDVLNKNTGSAIVVSARQQTKAIGISENSTIANATKVLSDFLNKIDFDSAISAATVLQEALSKNDTAMINAAVTMLRDSVESLNPEPAINAAKQLVETAVKADNSAAISAAKAKLASLQKGDGDIYSLAAKSAGMDFLIIGEAFSERVNGTVAGSGMISCRARVEAKIINVTTGDIIATHGFQMGGIDISEAVAAKRALNNAGEVMGDYLKNELMTYASKTAKPLRITLRNVPTFDKAKVFEDILQRAPGVKAVYVREYNAGKLAIDVDYTGVPKPLANLLERINSVDLVVNKVSYNAIEATMRY